MILLTFLLLFGIACRRNEKELLHRFITLFLGLMYRSVSTMERKMSNCDVKQSYSEEESESEQLRADELEDSLSSMSGRACKSKAINSSSRRTDISEVK